MVRKVPLTVTGEGKNQQLKLNFEFTLWACVESGTLCVRVESVLCGRVWNVVRGCSRRKVTHDYGNQCPSQL